MAVGDDTAFLEALKSVGIRVPAAPDAETAIEVGSSDHPAHTTATPAPPSTITARNIWMHPDAHPLVLDLALIRRYGHAWLGWDAETLRFLIPQDFGTATVSELNIAKLQACRTLHLVDSFWDRWEVFVACLMPFNSEFPDFRTMPVPTAAQCLVACDIANRIRSDVNWSSELRAYVSVVFTHDGIFLPLPPCNFVTPAIAEEVDLDEVVRRWPAARAADKPPTEQTPVAEQLRRMCIADHYLEESRERLAQQIQLHV